MPLNPNLFIAAPMLQDYLVGKDGKPLAGGQVFFSQDLQRQIFKNVYKLTGQPGAYTYTALPNPVILSSAGTFADEQGNDIIPYYYPYDEEDETQVQTYCVQAYAYNQAPDGEPTFTREDFPPGISSTITPDNSIQTLKNYIVNGEFYEAKNIDLTNKLNAIIAPSAHQALTFHDIQFFKNITGANDQIFFDDEESLGYKYLRFECSSVQVGETFKDIQFPLSKRLNLFANKMATFVFNARQETSSPNNQLEILLYKYLGTNAVNQPLPILLETKVVTGLGFQQYETDFIFPDFNLDAVSDCNDNAYYIRIRYPLSKIFDISISLPKIYLGEIIPTNDIDTYDAISSIIHSPRTASTKGTYEYLGDLENPFGYLPLDDGTIGSLISGATHSDIENPNWYLFRSLWNYGVLHPTLLPIFDSLGAPTTYGTSAGNDYLDNKRLSLPKSLGRVSATADPLTPSEIPMFLDGAKTVALTSANNGPHTHPLSGSTGSVDDAGGTPGTLNVGSAVGTANTLSSGSGTPFSILQPTVYKPEYIKL